MSTNQLRVVIAGQVPPPWGGQNIMVAKAVTQFSHSQNCQAVHLPFFFTPQFSGARKLSIRKITELIRVIGRLWRIRLGGPIDLVLYPTGGPQSVPMIRDLLLLPWILMLSGRVILYFHAAGIADRLEKDPKSALNRAIRFLYSRAFAAIVMTEFNRRDPESARIDRILVVPYRIDDEFDPLLVQRGAGSRVRLLYVGHLCADKGTPELLEALATLRNEYPELELDLVGECLPPFTEADLKNLIERLQIQSHVHLCGVLTGSGKAHAFGRADLFVFPTVAPYESFGLVVAEAMSWKLPIVVSNWRGNSDVLTSSAGAICFPVVPSLTSGIVAAVKQAIQRRSEWEEWSRRNRSIFEQRYKEGEPHDWLVQPIVSLLQTTAMSET
jgi:glycosyltransferase involved in cell wall biosynthesis